MTRESRTRQPPSFVGKTLSELDALHRFFLTLDTELERIVENEDLVTRATDPLIPSHEELVAAEERADPELEAQFAEELALLDEQGADQYWEDLNAKFRPHFYAAVTLLTVAVLEAGLSRLARHLMSRRRKPLISPGQVKGSTLDQFWTFAKIYDWRLPDEETQQWALDLYQVRNSLIHEGGSIYAVSQAELESKSKKLLAIAKRRPGIELESVYPETDIAQLFARVRRRLRGGKPAPSEGVIVRIQREFCSTAIERVRALLRDLYAPLLTPAKRRRVKISRKKRR